MTRISRKSVKQKSAGPKLSAQENSLQPNHRGHETFDEVQARGDVAILADDGQPVEDEDLAEADEHSLGGGGSADHIEDPVRIYLMQMGEIPLLSRKEEIAAARWIEKSRRRFRNTMLADRLHAPGSHRVARAGSRRKTPTRSHGGSVGHQRAGEAPDHAVAFTQPGDPGPPSRAEPGRLRRGDGQELSEERKTCRVATDGPASQQGRSVD